MMLSLPNVRDIQTYLRDNGWRESRAWRNALVWSRADGYEVLVPSRDDLGDVGLRVRELLMVLSAAEERSEDDIILDISGPLDDAHSFRVFPEEMPSGFISLGGGIGILRGVEAMIGDAAEAVVNAPPPSNRNALSPEARNVLQRVQLGSGTPGSYAVTVRVPVHIPLRPDAAATLFEDPSQSTDSEPLGRQVSLQLHDAIFAAQVAMTRSTPRDLEAFDRAVTSGVSAQLCSALSRLVDRQSADGFEVTTRWGHGLRSGLPADTVHFGRGAGAILSAAARHLKDVRITAESAEVTGVVDSLHGSARSGARDEWRIKVRGDLTMRGEAESGRAVWVRLSGRDDYERAIAAHREQRPVRVIGTLSVSGGRAEVTAYDLEFGTDW